MKITTKVGEIMTKDIVSVKTTDPVVKAIDLMVKKNIGSVIVTDEGKPVGILTERDIMKRCCPEKLCTREVRSGEIMTKPLITIEADAAIGEAAWIMMKNDIRRLLVTEKGKAVGIVTQKDVMRGTLNTFIALSSI